MNNIIYQNLSDFVTQLESGGRPKGGGKEKGDVPSLGAEHLTDFGGFNFENLRFIPRDYFDNMNKGIIQPEDILIVKDGATTGKVAMIRNGFPFKTAAVNEHLFILRVNKNKVYPQFLFYYLFSKLGQNYILRGFHGSAQGGITKSFVDNIKIPWFDLPVQRKIASILETCESAIQKRKEANRLSDEFIKSTFHEMFGDPLRNPKRWASYKIGDLIVETENGDPGDSPEKKFDYIDISSIDNITKVILQVRKISGKNAPSRARQLVKAGDILVSTVRPNLNAVAIVPDNLINPIASTGFCVLRVNENKIVIQYLFEITKSPFFITSLVRNAKGASYPAVTDNDVKNLDIPVPPLPEQKKFADIVQKVEKLKQKQRESEKQLTNLIHSLMQRAFRGGL